MGSWQRLQGYPVQAAVLGERLNGRAGKGGEWGGETGSTLKRPRMPSSLTSSLKTRPMELPGGTRPVMMRRSTTWKAPLGKIRQGCPGLGVGRGGGVVQTSRGAVSVLAVTPAMNPAIRWPVMLLVRPAPASRPLFP